MPVQAVALAAHKFTSGYEQHVNIININYTMVLLLVTSSCSFEYATQHHLSLVAALHGECTPHGHSCCVSMLIKLISNGTKQILRQD